MATMFAYVTGLTGASAPDSAAGSAPGQAKETRVQYQRAVWPVQVMTGSLNVTVTRTG